MSKLGLGELENKSQLLKQLNKNTSGAIAEIKIKSDSINLNCPKLKTKFSFLRSCMFQA